MSTVALLVGTKKGGFVYTSDERRERWEVSDPILPGWSFYHMAADLRGPTPRFYAAANHWAWGPSVAKSADAGKTWDFNSTNLAFPPGFTSPSIHPLPGDFGAPGEWSNTRPGAIGNVWCVTPGHASEPGVVYAGTQPAGLFRSEDWGLSWEPVDGINSHPYRKWWSGTGGGDSALHSIQVDSRDANRVYLCVGAGGSYRTKDGGKSWEMFSHNAIPTHPEAKRLMAEFGAPDPATLPPGKDPAGLDELHRLKIDAKNPDRFWGMAHWGVFFSEDCGETWTDVTEGLPSFHGFPIAVTKQGQDAVFVVPLDYGQDNFRVAPGQLAVYRTTDTGKSWDRLVNGLPGPHDYQSAYREALDTDGLREEAVYLGTSNGELFIGDAIGERWRRLPGTLPPILSVSVAVF